MFGFAPNLPVPEHVRQWADSAFVRLSFMLGAERMLKAEVILPDDRYFPDAFDGSKASVVAMAERIAAYMGIDPQTITVEIYAENEVALRGSIPLWSGEARDAGGLYFHKPEEDGRMLVGVHAKKVKEPLCLAATLAHELAHVLLLGGGILDPDVKDMEPLTDMCTVFLGLGILGANAAFQFRQWTNNETQGWSWSRNGYLAEELWGYTLARFAWERGETRPSWEDALQPNIRGYFRQSMKWLKKHADIAAGPHDPANA